MELLLEQVHELTKPHTNFTHERLLINMRDDTVSRRLHGGGAAAGALAPHSALALRVEV